MNLRLNHAALNGGARGSTLRLTWGLIAVGDMVPLVVDDLSSHEPHFQDDLELVVDNFQPTTGSRYELAVSIRRDLNLPEPQEILFQEHELELLDTMGQPLRSSARPARWPITARRSRPTSSARRNVTPSCDSLTRACAASATSRLSSATCRCRWGDRSNVPVRATRVRRSSAAWLGTGKPSPCPLPDRERRKCTSGAIRLETIRSASLLFDIGPQFHGGQAAEDFLQAMLQRAVLWTWVEFAAANPRQAAQGLVLAQRRQKLQPLDAMSLGGLLRAFDALAKTRIARVPC